MTDKCMKPEWHDRCCCNCKNQVVIGKHPWNKGVGKGRVTDIMGYGCAVAYIELQEVKPPIIFMDRRDGMCEMHEFKEPL